LSDEVMRGAETQKPVNPVRFSIETEDQARALIRNRVQWERTTITNSELEDRSAGLEDSLAEHWAMSIVTACNAGEEVSDPALNNLHAIQMARHANDKSLSARFELSFPEI
jgi:hypothetical protein